MRCAVIGRSLPASLTLRRISRLTVDAAGEPRLSSGSVRASGSSCRAAPARRVHLLNEFLEDLSLIKVKYSTRRQLKVPADHSRV